MKEPIGNTEQLSGDRPQPVPEGAVRALPANWRHRDEVPAVKAGELQWFWVAVRRDDGRIVSMPAAYLNALGLDNDDDPIEEPQQGNRYRYDVPDEDEDHCMIASGWHDARSHGEYDALYLPLLTDKEELIAWMPMPEYGDAAPPPDASGGAFAALRAAATSLRTIADHAGRMEHLEDLWDVRAYANSRAAVAEAAIRADGEAVTLEAATLAEARVDG